MRREVRDKYDNAIDGLRAPQFTDEDRWVTEIGFPSGSTLPKVDNAVSEKRQRQRLLVTFMQYASPKIKAFVVHRLHDGAENNDFGVIGVDGHRKLA